MTGNTGTWMGADQHVPGRSVGLQTGREIVQQTHAIFFRGWAIVVQPMTMLPTGTPTSEAITGHFTCSKWKTSLPQSLSVS